MFYAIIIINSIYNFNRIWFNKNIPVVDVFIILT